MLLNARGNNSMSRFCGDGRWRGQDRGNVSASMRVVRAVLFAGLFWLTLAPSASAQLVTIGGGSAREQATYRTGSRTAWRDATVRTNQGLRNVIMDRPKR